MEFFDEDDQELQGELEVSGVDLEILGHLEAEHPGIRQRVMSLGYNRDAQAMQRILGEFCPKLPEEGAPPVCVCQERVNGEDSWQDIWLSRNDGEIFMYVKEEGPFFGDIQFSIFDFIAVSYLGYEGWMDLRERILDEAEEEEANDEENEDEGETDNLSEEEVTLAKTRSQFFVEYGRQTQGIHEDRNNAGFCCRTEVSISWKENPEDEYVRLEESGESVTWASGYNNRWNESPTTAEQLEGKPFNFVLVDYYSKNNERQMSGRPNQAFHTSKTIVIVPDGADLRERTRAIFRSRYEHIIDDCIFEEYGEELVSEAVAYMQTYMQTEDPLADLRQELKAIKAFDKAV